MQHIQNTSPNLVILDLMLPGLDGLGVCRAVREFSDAPVLMMTARVDEIERLLGLDTGADDYGCKPFSPRELMARVRALLRRAVGRIQVPTVPWSVDDEALRLSWHGRALPLTALEFRMLRLLLSQPGRVFSLAQLLDSAHAELRDVSGRTIDSHSKNLRC